MMTKDKKQQSIFTDAGKAYFDTIYGYYDPILKQNTEELEKELVDVTREDLNKLIKEKSDELFSIREELQIFRSHFTDMIKWKINEGYGYLGNNKPPTISYLRSRYIELSRLVVICKEGSKKLKKETKNDRT